MTHPYDHDPNCACSAGDDPPARPRGISRRGVLGAALAGFGVVGLSRVGAASPGVEELNGAGSALLPATRIPPPTTTLPTTLPITIPPAGGIDPTDLTTVVGPLPFTPPEPGEMLFPIVVGEGDHCGVLNNYGDRRGRTDGYFHQGVDIMADGGLPIRAVVDGVLTQWYTGRFNGWRLYDDVNDVLYKYFHNTPNPNGWVEGDRVAQGDIIGFVGDTGTSPGNYHLHFEYRPGDVPADAYPLLQRPENVLFW